MRAPVWSAMIAPNGMATRHVGRIETLATNHSCWTNSRHWTGRRNAARTVSRDIAAKLPASRKTHLAGIVVMSSVGSQGQSRTDGRRSKEDRQDSVIMRAGKVGETSRL